MKKFTGWLIIIFCSFLSLVFLVTIFVLITGDIVKNSTLFTSKKDMLVSGFGFIMMVVFIFQGFKKGIELLRKEQKSNLPDQDPTLDNSVPDAVNQFSIREDGFKEIKKEILKKTLPTFILSSLIGIFLVFYNSTDTQNSIYAIVLPIIFLLAIIPFSLNRGIEKQIKLLKTYKLIVEPEGIRREQDHTQTVFIKNTDISEIAKNANGGFVVKGRTKYEIITVPGQINNYQQLEQLLAQLRPIMEHVKVPVIQKYGSILSIITIGLMVAVYVSETKMVVGICGAVSLLFLIYSFIEIRKNKQLDKKTRLTSWYVLLIILSISIAMYVKLTASSL